jgi:hypothetical protein
MSDSVDWDKALAGQGSGLPDIPVEGWYPIIVTSAEAVTSSTGKPMAKLYVKVTEGPSRDKGMYTNIVFDVESEKGMKWTLRKLSALGVSREWIKTAKPSVSAICKRLEGAEAEADITIKTWEGEKQNDINRLRPLDGIKEGVQAPVPTPPSGGGDVPAPPVPLDDDVSDAPPPIPSLGEDEPF